MVRVSALWASRRLSVLTLCARAVLVPTLPPVTLRLAVRAPGRHRLRDASLSQVGAGHGATRTAATPATPNPSTTRNSRTARRPGWRTSMTQKTYHQPPRRFFARILGIHMACPRCDTMHVIDPRVRSSTRDLRHTGRFRCRKCRLVLLLGVVAYGVTPGGPVAAPKDQVPTPAEAAAIRAVYRRARRRRQTRPAQTIPGTRRSRTPQPSPRA